MHMHIVMAGKRLRTTSPPLLPCACASLRRAARAVSQLYDEALRPTGLRITQFTLLQFLARTGEPITQGMLGDRLALDSTTLSRTLTPLQRAGWIRSRRATDGRERHLTLAAAGRRILERATPAWERAQRRLHRGLGPADWTALQRLLTSVVRTVRQGRHEPRNAGDSR